MQFVFHLRPSPDHYYYSFCEFSFGADIIVIIIIIITDPPGELNGKEESPTVAQKSQSAGDTRNLGTRVCDFFCPTGILHQLLRLIALYTVLKSVTRFICGLHDDFMLHTTENMMD